MVGGEHSLKISAPQLFRDKQQLEDSEQKDHRLNGLINELMTKVFIEQPRQHREC